MHGASLTAKNKQGYTAATLAEGTELEHVLPSKEEINRSPLETRLIDFLVALIMFIIAYTNSDTVQEIVGEIVSKLNEDDNIDDEMPSKFAPPRNLITQGTI